MCMSSVLLSVKAVMDYGDHVLQLLDACGADTRHGHVRHEILRHDLLDALRLPREPQVEEALGGLLHLSSGMLRTVGRHLGFVLGHHRVVLGVGSSAGAHSIATRGRVNSRDFFMGFRVGRGRQDQTVSSQTAGDIGRTPCDGLIRL